jgi:hypothetical protein
MVKKKFKYKKNRPGVNKIKLKKKKKVREFDSIEGLAELLKKYQDDEEMKILYKELEIGRKKRKKLVHKEWKKIFIKVYGSNLDKYKSSKYLDNNIWKSIEKIYNIPSTFYEKKLPDLQCIGQGPKSNFFIFLFL